MTRTSENGTSQFVRVPHILVIDDDPIFRRVMEVVGKHKNVDVTICRTFKELCALSVPLLFDAAIVDYYLDDLMDNLKGPLVADAMGDTPIILVSRRESCIEDTLNWPNSIQKFMSKNEGGNAIFDAAMSAINATPKTT